MRAVGFRERPNIAGQAYSLVLVVPIAPGREAEVRGRLEELEPGERSPLADVAGTHFARLAVIEGLNHEGPGRRRQLLQYQYLLFAAVFDRRTARRGRPARPRTAQRYLTELVEQAGPAADAIWGLCDGYPYDGDSTDVATWLRLHQIDTGYLFAPYGAATVGEVLESLELREELRAYAVEMQDEHPEVMQAQFQERFGARP